MSCSDFGKALLGNGKLVHESETHVVLFAREINGSKAAAEMALGFPTDLFAETGSVADSLDIGKFAHELKRELSGENANLRCGK